MMRASMKRLFLPLAVLLFVSSTGCRHRHASNVVYLQQQPAAVVVSPATPPVLVEGASAPFDRDAATKALGAVDLSACRAEGAPATTVHASVTYAPEGNISRVTVDRPAGLTVGALSCIGRLLGAARVPVFEGDAVTVSRSYTIR